MRHIMLSSFVIILQTWSEKNVTSYLGRRIGRVSDGWFTPPNHSDPHLSSGRGAMIFGGKTMHGNHLKNLACLYMQTQQKAIRLACCSLSTYTRLPESIFSHKRNTTVRQPIYGRLSSSLKKQQRNMRPIEETRPMLLIWNHMYKIPANAIIFVPCNHSIEKIVLDAIVPTWSNLNMITLITHC